MLSYIAYGVLIFALVLWVEHPQLLLVNSLNIRVHPAEALEDWLKKFNWGNRSEISEKTALPRYKFYTDVVEVLLSLARRMGGNYQDSLLFLRQGLQSDRQFEKKLKEIILGTWLQMGMMMFLTWAFIVGALLIVDIQVASAKLLLIFLWQSIGLSLLPFMINKYRRHFFADIGKMWKMLYVLNSLARVPLSRTEILQMADVQELKNIQQKNLLHLVEKLKQTCKQALKQGGSYEEEVRSLMEELRFQEKWHFELFEKRLTVIKLVLLSLFFLPSYLAFIFLLIGDLMTLM